MRIISSALLTVQLLSVAPSAFAASMVASEEIAVEYAVTQGMLTPMADGLLHPEAPFSRIDLLKAIVHDVYKKDVTWGCFGLLPSRPTISYSHLFNDIPKTYTYAQEICAGMLTGIVQGRDNGNFEPNAGATLAETAKIISKSYGLAAPPALMPETVRWDEPYWYALARRNVLPERIRNERDEVITRGEFASMMFLLRNERPKYGARYENAPAESKHDVAAAEQSSFAAVSATAVTEEGLALQSHVAERRENRLSVLQASTPDTSQV